MSDLSYVITRIVPSALNDHGEQAAARPQGEIEKNPHDREVKLRALRRRDVDVATEVPEAGARGRGSASAAAIDHR